MSCFILVLAANQSISSSLFKFVQTVMNCCCSADLIILAEGVGNKELDKKYTDVFL